MAVLSMVALNSVNPRHSIGIALETVYKKCSFLKRFWEQEPVKRYFGIGIVDEYADEKIQWSSPFLLGGALASVLNNGGAYEKPSWGGAKGETRLHSEKYDSFRGITPNNWQD